MCSRGFLDSILVSERFVDVSYLRGWQVFVGVISFGGSLCYTGQCSSSLALVCVFWVVKVFRVFGECVSRCNEPFPFDFVVVCTIAYHVFRLTYCVLVSGGLVILLRDRESVSNCNLV